MSGDARRQSAYQRLYVRLGQSFGQSLFAEVTQTPSLKPRLTVSKVSAFALAAVVHSLTFFIAGLGVALIIFGWPVLYFVLPGAPCLGVAWVLRPRIPTYDEQVVPRDQFPTLCGLTNRIAAALGTSPVTAWQ
jgi:hypothetical protein